MKRRPEEVSESGPPLIERRLRTAIRAKLLRWYDRHRRDLPWRHRASDPYAQWVAEIMLQQTRVDTVIAYYEPFLRRFPTVSSLARAEDEQILKRWEGLGYYRRALNLRDAARVVRQEGGRIPGDSERLRRLPGIGAYTAAAVASIAFGEPIAAVDGNALRVLARLFGLDDDVHSSAGKKRIGRLASELVSPGRPGDFNQAWMDLGSVICTPSGPDCLKCPLSRHCSAAATGRTGSLPNRDRARRREIPQVDVLVAVFRHGRKFLVRRRPPRGLWSGLWEFPNIDIPQRSAGNQDSMTRELRVPAALGTTRILRQLAEQTGVVAHSHPCWAGRVCHRLTHRALTFHVYVADAISHNGDGATGKRWHRWVTQRGFRALSVSTAHRRIHDVVWALEGFGVHGRDHVATTALDQVPSSQS